ncbi:MAG: U32 family peptidase [Bacilli bacterium]|nr:U32 family peptidase [Bacilli bacterium]
MKLLIEPSTKNNLYSDYADGIILPLENYAVESIISFSLAEIKKITKNSDCEVFIKINKNLLNEDIDDLTNILKELDKLNITGIFFYDLAVLELKNELKLKTDLVWNQTHMVNNYRTCDYYFNHGVKYALLGKEITLDEIIEIINKSKITSIVEVVSKPSVAFSKRKLVTNYYKDLGKTVSNDIIVKEKITDSNYEFIEDNNGTSIFLDKITNGTVIIKELYDNNCQYIIFKEYGINDFKELVIDTMNYIRSHCEDERYVSKYSKLGDSTNFFFKKTIYKVKK